MRAPPAAACMLGPMLSPEGLALALGVFAVAVLYASVGHAGASGYIAVMSLAGLSPAEIRPLALTLNVIVATVATAQFWRAGHLSFQLLWPFCVLSVPLAFVGGRVSLPVDVFEIVLGAVLLFSAWRLVAHPPAEGRAAPPPAVAAIGVGGALGLLAGLTGTGGGIFLTPILLFRRWAGAKTAAATSAPYILVNSIAGLIGALSVPGGALPAVVVPLGIAALVGGSLGAWLGSRKLSPTRIKRVLAVVLAIAGCKLLLT